jgi:DNA modification methylase
VDIQTLPLDRLTPAAYNPRHDLQPGDPAYESLQRSITEFGCVEPVVWNRQTGNVVSGHQRLKVLRQLGHAETACVVVDLDPDRERALNLAMNKIAGAWDETRLRDLLASFSPDFDATLSGFDMDEIRALLEQGAQDDDFDAQVAYDDIEEPVTHRGDIWTLCCHRLLCGDSTGSADVARLMGGEEAQLIITDPPYNVDYHGEAGSIQNDSMADGAFYEFLFRAFGLMADFAAPGAAAYIFHADTQGTNFRRAFVEAGFDLKQVLVWVKNHFVLGRQDFQWRHEPVLYGWKPGAAHYFCGDRTQDTVIDDSAPPDIGKMKKAELQQLLRAYIERDQGVPQTVIYHDRPMVSEDHPTMKPVSLLGRLMQYSSRPDDLVFDPFGGSGSTLIAAEQLGRRACLLEIDPKFCDVVVRRWEEATGQKAIRNAL